MATHVVKRITKSKIKKLLPYKNVTRAEVTQAAFDILFEKYGGNGMEAAIKAVKELYPTYKGRKFMLRKVRGHLVDSNFAVDMVTSLEAKGVTAHKLADKINYLLDATRTKMAYNKITQLVEESVEPDSTAIDKGITQALKVGVGGGYAPERSLLGIKDFSLGKLLDQLENKKENEPEE